MLLAEFAAFCVLAVEHELADVGEGLESCGIDVAVVGAARPYGGFRKIETLGGCSAVDHCTDATVA